MTLDPNDKRDEIVDEIEELNETIERLGAELKKFGTPSAGNHPIEARQRFIRLFNEHRGLRQRRQELEDELSA
jgi:hypothetical protein